MILKSVTTDIDALECLDHIFFYGLGFEARSMTIAERVPCKMICAIKMPDMDIHSSKVNSARAREMGHRIIQCDDNNLGNIIGEVFEERRLANSRLRVGFDISSLNRPTLFSVLTALARHCSSEDELVVYYTPAAFSEPDWRFPQIESIGPLAPEFSGYNSSPTKPFCLVLGLGFEPGISMGIISQLEPRVSFCFWGTGLDSRFDAAVERANFEFKFTGFETKTFSYLIKDSKGTYDLLEGLTYGLLRNFNVVFAPMGPKIFALHTALLAFRYPGEMAVWRVQQRHILPPDSLPGGEVVKSIIDLPALRRAVQSRDEMLTNI